MFSCVYPSLIVTWHKLGFPGRASGKEPASRCREFKSHGFYPSVAKIPCRRKWHPTPIFLPGKFHGQRSLVDYRPYSVPESQTWLSNGEHTQRSQTCTIPFSKLTNVTEICQSYSVLKTPLFCKGLLTSMLQRSLTSHSTVQSIWLAEWQRRKR